MDEQPPFMVLFGGTTSKATFNNGDFLLEDGKHLKDEEVPTILAAMGYVRMTACAAPLRDIRPAHPFRFARSVGPKCARSAPEVCTSMSISGCRNNNNSHYYNYFCQPLATHDGQKHAICGS